MAWTFSSSVAPGSTNECAEIWERGTRHCLERPESSKNTPYGRMDATVPRTIEPTSGGGGSVRPLASSLLVAASVPSGSRSAPVSWSTRRALQAMRSDPGRRWSPLSTSRTLTHALAPGSRKNDNACTRSSSLSSRDSRIPSATCVQCTRPCRARPGNSTNAPNGRTDRTTTR